MKATQHNVHLASTPNEHRSENPEVTYLELLVLMGILRKMTMPNGVVQYFAARAPTHKEWPEVMGLLHKASSWCGTRGLSVTCGSLRTDIIYRYEQE